MKRKQQPLIPVSYTHLEFEVEVIAEKVPAPVDRDDNRIVYFVDCGDYIVSTDVYKRQVMDFLRSRASENQ